MKTLALFCCLFVFVSLAALDTPANLGANAVSHEGFTARWDAVTGATSYGLEVVEGTITTIAETSFETATIPSGWVANSIGYSNNTSYANTGSYSASFNAVDDWMKTSSLNKPQMITFFARTTQNNAQNNLKIEYSSNGTEWFLLRNLSANGSNSGDIINSYRIFKLLLNSSVDIYIRWSISSFTRGVVLIDDVSVETGNEDMYNEMLSGTTTNRIYRVSALSPNTTYSYRVMARNASSQSAYSSWQTVLTTDNTPGIGTSTSIGGAPVTISVPPIALTTNNNVTFDPDGIVDADISVVVSSGVRSLNFALSSSSALYGSYTIHHEGFSPTEIRVDSGNLSNVIIGEASSTFTLSGLLAKGSVIVTLGQDETLPVQLSSFLVSPSDTHAAIIRWQTASETGVNGYVILRSDTDCLQDASIVSPLIYASNTSTQQSYQFTDETVQCDSWYWLMVGNIDGSEELFGPRFFKIQDSDEVPEFVFNNALISIYPNPFNPDTQMVFSLKARENVGYRLFNVRGQLVLQKSLGQKEAGKHQIIFEGRDENGKVLSSGMYILEVHLGQEKHYQKMMLQK